MNPITKPKNEAAAALGRAGGAARASKLTPAQRQAIARLGGLKRARNAGQMIHNDESK